MDRFNNPSSDSILSLKYFNPDYLAEHAGSFLYNFFYFIFFSGTFKAILAIFTIFFLTIIAYTSVRLLELRRKEHAHLHHEIEEYAHHMAEKEKKRSQGEGVSRNEKWNNVLMHLLSSNPAEWKLAIIEADMMLETLMDQLGFSGNSLGERLKSADREKFPQLTKAWEVHTIRNRIAHEGSDFELPIHEAKRVVAIYESIFMEFGFI